MKTLPANNFNLKATIESGQIFRWHYNSSNGFYYIVSGGSVIRIRQKGRIIEYDVGRQEFDVKKFFGLNQDYNEILSSINRDEKIAAAIGKHHGLRILEQGFWECTASFICSSFSNIPRIRQCIERVAAEFGEKMELSGFSTSSFPQPRQINNFSRLNKCGLGYRAKYLFETASVIASSPEEYSPPQLHRLGYGAAKKKLMELPGVGSKVADCILLFSCGFFEAFPVNVWIQRVMERDYGGMMAAARGSRAEINPKKAGEKLVGEFARCHFGNYAGYAQQFLYHNARTQKKPGITSRIEHQEVF